MAASNSPVGRYNNAVTIVNDVRKKIDSLKANDPEVCDCYGSMCESPVFSHTYLYIFYVCSLRSYDQNYSLLLTML